MTKPKTFEALVRAGGPARFVREAMKEAARAERQHWLKTLERGPVPHNTTMADSMPNTSAACDASLASGNCPLLCESRRASECNENGLWGTGVRKKESTS